VNFHGIPHLYDGTDWKPVKPDVILPEHQLAHTFTYEDERSMNYVQQTNPAYQDLVMDHINVMAEMVAIMNQHDDSFKTDHEGTIIHTSSGVAKTLTEKHEIFGIVIVSQWYDSAKFYGGMFVVVIVILVILRCCYLYGCCHSIWYACCRIKRRINPPAPRDEPMINNMRMSTLRRRYDDYNPDQEF
jgi:hypothetical protein